MNTRSRAKTPRAPSPSRVLLLDSDGQNPYSLSFFRGLKPSLRSVDFVRRAAPVAWQEGCVFGPSRGSSGSKALRALSLATGILRLAGHIRRAQVVHVLWGETPLDAVVAVFAKYAFRK